jgi:HK97 family phage prohead protease
MAKAETYKPTEAIQNKAKKVLKWVEENGWGSCGTDVGKQRASQLAKGENLTLSTVKRMYSYLSRAGEYYDGGSYEKCGNLMYDAWGGKPALSWSKKIVNQAEKSEPVNGFQTKSTALIIKDIDTTKGIVQGYFSAFGNTDSHGDVMLPGAFAKSIAENGPNGTDRIAHLYLHDSERPIGKLLRLEEDATGLLFESKMSKTQLGQDVLTMYEEGIIKEHSVGFFSVRDKYTELRDEEDKISGYEFQEVKLLEGSSVVWGANSQTPVTSIKSDDNILARIDELEQFVRNTAASDETVKSLLEEIEQLKSTSLGAEESHSEPIDLVELYKSI